VNVPVVQQQPILDGKVSPQEQSLSAKVSMTVVGSLDKPKYPTTAYTFLTPQGVYVGYVCEEPAPDKLVTAAQNENDAVFQDDSVQLFVAPDREANNTNYFHFAVNANGVKYSTNMGDDSPVAGWLAAAAKGEKNWSAEMFIPFTSLEARTEVPYWRVNFARERPERSSDKKEITAWINPGASLHNYKRFGFFQIANRIPPAPSAPIVAVSGATAATLAPATPALLTTATAFAAQPAVTSATVSVTTGTLASTTTSAQATTSTGVFAPR